MSNSLAVKCYLVNATNQDSEIRRFNLDADVVGNYTYLMEKVRSVYPQLLRENFSLMYIDEENDKVTISSDEELVAALICVKRKDGEPFRLFIQPSGGPRVAPTTSASNGNTQGEVHFMVTCDGCEGPVRGFRYKCLQCPDYDLCGKCETNGLHPGHPMIRVSGVLPPYFPAIRQMASNGHGSGREGHHGRHRGPRWGHCGRGNGWQQNHWNAWCPSGTNVETDQAEEKKDKKTEEKPCPWKYHMDQAKRTAQNLQQATGSEFLQNLGSTISTILEQFGVDTQVDVHVPGQTPPCAQGEAKKESEAEESEKKRKEDERKAVEEAWRAMSQAGWVVPNEPVSNERVIPIRVEAKDETVTTGQTKEAAKEQPKVEVTGQAAAVPVQERIVPVQERIVPVQVEQTFVKSEPVPPVTTEIAKTASPYQSVTAQLNEAAEMAKAAAVARAAEAATSALLAAKAAETAAALNCPVTSASAPPAENDKQSMAEWTLVGQDGKEVGSPKSLTPPRELGVRPKVQTTEEPLHPDPLIAGALETMLNMGFTNEGGWLAQLLEVKGGDIGKVLDVLQPVKRN